MTRDKNHCNKTIIHLQNLYIIDKSLVLCHDICKYGCLEKSLFNEYNIEHTVKRKIMLRRKDFNSQQKYLNYTPCKCKCNRYLYMVFNMVIGDWQSIL